VQVKKLRKKGFVTGVLLGDPRKQIPDIFIKIPAERIKQLAHSISLEEMKDERTYYLVLDGEVLLVSIVKWQLKPIDLYPFEISFRRVDDKPRSLEDIKTQKYLLPPIPFFPPPPTSLPPRRHFKLQLKESKKEVTNETQS